MLSTFESMAKGLFLIFIVYVAVKVGGQLPLLRDAFDSINGYFASAKAELNVSVLEDAASALQGLTQQGHDALMGASDHVVSTLR